MKITVSRNDIAAAVGATAKQLPAKPAHAVLAGVMLSAAETKLAVSGFDYELSTESGVDAKVDEPGKALVSAKLLAEITKALPNKPVTISTVGSHVEIICGSARFTLPTMIVEDYPTLPDMPAVAGTVDAATFASAVARVAPSIGRDDALPILTGLRIESTGDQLTLLATDRFRLAICEIPWRSAGQDIAALMPGRVAVDTAKMMDSAAPIDLAIGNGMIGFEGGNRRTTSRLITGDFPPVRRLLPNSFGATALVLVSTLNEVVRRVGLVAERSTPIRLSFSEDGLVVEASGGEDARASEAMDCTYSGEPMTIAFNHQYLLDGLAAVRTPTAVISFNDPKKPATLTPAGEDGTAVPGFVYLMMPVRTEK